jgi:hypothetical protein
VDRGDVLQARAVHQDVSASGQRRGVEVGGQVHLEGPPADAGGDRIGGGHVDVRHDDAGPGVGQPVRAGLADTAGPAGHYRQPPGQILTHR